MRAPEDPFEAQGNRDALVELSGALKVIAVSLTKIANDLALMGSGPRAGIGELFLPELQKGSSIMPGKVNPVIPEVVLQVGAQVIGNDTAITIGGLQGQFELNVRIPLIARNLLQSIALLAATSELFAEKCIDGIEAEPGRLRGVRRGHARRRHRAQPVHRLRQGHGDRQGRVGERPHAARGRARARRRRGDARRGARPAQDRRRLVRVSPVGTDADLLERIEAYCDAAPRAAADVEEHGAITLFVSRIPWRYSGRPRLGLAHDVGADDVAAVRARQRELGVRESFEWMHETTPVARRRRAGGRAAGPARAAARARAGRAGRPRRRRTGVERAPARRRRRGARRRPGRGGARVRDAGDGVGPAGPAQRDVATAGLADLGFLRERIRRGLTVVAVAEDPAPAARSARARTSRSAT